ncbi:3-isopropylmalate dehydratase, small subunit [Pyrolobus fumarii 1A]|uniref:3-isopropylmalate dehydratase small subunit n=1 Tax=Pyrolobus fumarii (strain DSM 11204 / 1A) TaxID=694429 RepID=G0ECA9_PYRF1|nr:3-isopropylmalate dehydratase small subunit [Pyrolobus fumarii]AEM39479.1 3-isopropylmalate dehydratase, small subunit [Pyrolobus fumarii 1A]
MSKSWIVRGRAIRLGDDINTDFIIPYQYKARTLDPKELAKHVFEGLDPELPKRIRPGDIVVAGKNFGYGSSREQAPLAIKAAGIQAVIAESFARIFYRNAINLGLIVVEAPRKFIDSVETGDTVEVRLEEGVVRNVSKGVEASVKPLPEFVRRIVEAGGLAGYLKKHGKFPWEE